MSTKLKGKSKSAVAFAMLLQMAGKGKISQPVPAPNHKPIVPKAIALAVNAAFRNGDKS